MRFSAIELSKELDKYIENNISPESLQLRRIRKETYLKTTQPHMLSGHLQGRLLSMISKISSPQNILEIGTFTAYSTFCLAEGLTPEGKIYTIDKNEEQAHLIQKFIQESEHKDKIIYILGEALTIIEQLTTIFDLIFIDADKENYTSYLDAVLPLVKSGGIIIVDNILWKGKVTDSNPDKKTQHILDFNQYVRNHNDLEVVILPIRDGISIIRKIN